MPIMLAETFLQAHSVEESFISKDFKEAFATSETQPHKYKVAAKGALIQALC